MKDNSATNLRHVQGCGAYRCGHRKRRPVTMADGVAFDVSKVCGAVCPLPRILAAVFSGLHGLGFWAQPGKSADLVIKGDATKYLLHSLNFKFNSGFIICSTLCFSSASCRLA